MKLALTHRKKAAWNATMQRLAKQSLAAPAPERDPLYAEARKATDNYVRAKAQLRDAAACRQHVTKLLVHMEQRKPDIAAFVRAAEDPRWVLAERNQVRVGFDAASDALAARRYTVALTHLRTVLAAMNGLAKRTYTEIARSDAQRVLASVVLLNAGDEHGALAALVHLLEDIGERGEHPSRIQLRVLSDTFARVLEAFDRCDRLVEHRRTDMMLPWLMALAANEAVFPIAARHRDKFMQALSMGPQDSIATYLTLRDLAHSLRARGGPHRGVAAIVQLCADRRLRDAYWQAHSADDEVPAALLPSPSCMWAFNKACIVHIKAFQAQQWAAFEQATGAAPTSVNDAAFAATYFNTATFLRYAQAVGALRGRSNLEVTAMLHYFVEDLTMLDEA